jgi:hypothetical protein
LDNPTFGASRKDGVLRLSSLFIFIFSVFFSF